MSRGGIRGPRLAWREATRARYAAVISGQMPTTAAVALDLGLTHVGALQMLLKLEREGFIFRTVTKPAICREVLRWSLFQSPPLLKATPARVDAPTKEI